MSGCQTSDHCCILKANFPTCPETIDKTSRHPPGRGRVELEKEQGQELEPGQEQDPGKEQV